MHPQAFTGAMFMRTSTVRGVGGFDRDLNYCMDMDLLARILLRGLTPTLVGIPLAWGQQDRGATGFRRCP